MIFEYVTGCLSRNIGNKLPSILLRCGSLQARTVNPAGVLFSLQLGLCFKGLTHKRKSERF
jgi:hypothetical protein